MMDTSYFRHIAINALNQPGGNQVGQHDHRDDRKNENDHIFVGFHCADDIQML